MHVQTYKMILQWSSYRNKPLMHILDWFSSKMCPKTFSTSILHHFWDTKSIWILRLKCEAMGHVIACAFLSFSALQSFDHHLRTTQTTARPRRIMEMGYTSQSDIGTQITKGWAQSSRGTGVFCMSCVLYCSVFQWV